MEKEIGHNGGHNGGHIENIRTVSRVPGNPHYYEKDGLRTYGDDEDHDHEPPVSLVPAITQFHAVIVHTDDNSPFDVLDCHGLFVDWIPNSGILVW